MYLQYKSTILAISIYECRPWKTRVNSTNANWDIQPNSLQKSIKLFSIYETSGVRGDVVNLLFAWELFFQIEKSNFRPDVALNR
jgi:hypothetical protein